MIDDIKIIGLSNKLFSNDFLIHHMDNDRPCEWWLKIG